MRRTAESGGFHKQPCLEEHAACSARSYVGVISLLKEIKTELFLEAAEVRNQHGRHLAKKLLYEIKICK